MTMAPPRPAAAPQLRPGEPADLPAIQAIYAHHVLHGLASFEETAPDVAEMGRRRRAVVDAGLPYLVAELDGRVVGYAYAGPYRTRPAYRHTLENSVYIAEDCRGRGVGRALLAAVVEACTRQGYRQMVAIIGDSANHASIRLHEAAGFRRVGTLASVGFKHGRWVDSVLLQRPLGAGDGTPPERP